MSNIIHNPRELMTLDRETLDELLLSEYKNSALLRELVRVCLSELKEQTKLTNFHKDNTLDKLEDMKKDINELIDRYKYS